MIIPVQVSLLFMQALKAALSTYFVTLLIEEGN